MSDSKKTFVLLKNKSCSSIKHKKPLSFENFSLLENFSVLTGSKLNIIFQ